MAHKSTDAEVNRRVAEAVTYIVKGKRRIEWVEYATKRYKITDRAADEYLARARDLITAEWGRQRQDLLAQMLAKIEDIYAEARQERQLNTALAAVNSQARLTQIIS